MPAPGSALRVELLRISPLRAVPLALAALRSRSYVSYADIHDYSFFLTPSSYHQFGHDFSSAWIEYSAPHSLHSDVI